MILIDLAGDTVEGEGSVERSAFHIHSALHLRRPDLRCFLHAHMPYATALSMLKDNRLRPYGQQALRFHTKCAYYDHYNALAHQQDEGERMAEALADRRGKTTLASQKTLTNALRNVSSPHAHLDCPHHCRPLVFR